MYALLMFAVTFSTGGCSEPPKQKTLGVTQISDKVHESELIRFLAVVEQLPDGRLPDLEPLFGPPPNWLPTRSLPIRDLVKEEQLSLSTRWDIKELEKQLEANRRLTRALRREEMTLEEFCNLLEAIGAALTRNGLRKDQDLDKIQEIAKIPLDKLRSDGRTFSELSRDEMHTILRQAVCITRDDRAKRLSRVPPENLVLVKQHSEALAKILPREFTTNPFDPLIDLLEVRGMPFEELPESGSDVELDWSHANMKRGIDAPDPEFRETSSLDKDVQLSPVVSH